jgi:hypothetical protein
MAQTSLQNLLIHISSRKKENVPGNIHVLDWNPLEGQDIAQGQGWGRCTLSFFAVFSIVNMDAMTVTCRSWIPRFTLTAC